MITTYSELKEKKIGFYCIFQNHLIAFELLVSRENSNHY